jgi:serine/threonine protein phosphatase PrpC
MDAPSRHPKLDVGSATHRGRRAENQDVAGVGGSWFAVADGIGGHAGGRLAAELTVDAVRQALADGATFDEQAVLLAVRKANDEVRFGQRADASVHDMGSTLTLVALATADDDTSSWILANVGDSPAWAVRSDAIELVAVEHSMAADLVAAGVISAEQAATHPAKHVVTRAIGLDDDVVADVRRIGLPPGGALVLASDGIDAVPPAEIARVIANAADADRAAVQLVDLALRKGATDNITVVVVVFQPEWQKSPNQV